MDNRRMPERQILTFIANLIAKGSQHWDSLTLLVIGLTSGALTYLSDVRSGDRKWDLAALALSVLSSVAFTFGTNILCLEVLDWSPRAALAASGIVAYLGGDTVRRMLAHEFTRRFK